MAGMELIRRRTAIVTTATAGRNSLADENIIINKRDIERWLWDLLNSICIIGDAIASGAEVLQKDEDMVLLHMGAG